MGELVVAMYDTLSMLAGKAAKAAAKPAAKAAAKAGGKAAAHASAHASAHAAAHATAYPEAYPVSVQHILNVTSLAFAVGMLFFFYLGVWKHQGKRLLPVFVFFASVIGAISYYAELCGVGTHAAAGGHLLFYTRYADAALALPILAGVVAALSRMHRHAIVALVANTLFAVAAEFIGANVVSHYKWGWFALAVVFTFMAVEQIVRVMQDTATSEQLKVLCTLLLIAYLAYPIKWCVGAEGSGRLATATEVGAIAFVDVVSRLGFGFYLLLHSDELENANPALLANDKA